MPVMSEEDYYLIHEMHADSCGWAKDMCACCVRMLETHAQVTHVLLPCANLRSMLPTVGFHEAELYVAILRFGSINT